MSPSVRRFPFPATHDPAHAATHARWLDVVVMQEGRMFGRFVTEACCDERLTEKLAAAAAAGVTVHSRLVQPDGIAIDATVDSKPAQLVVRELQKAPSKEWRERWARSTPQGRKPFRVTGRKDIVRAVGRTVRGPCNYVDGRVIDLLLDTNKTLYGMINGARAIDVEFPDDRHAVNEMVLGMAVLTASEADALATLLQLDQIPASRIHARAIGEHAEHVSAFLNDWSLAKTAYEATNASRQQLLDKMTLPDPIRKQILDRIDATHEPRTMETVMREGMKEFRKGETSMMGAVEHSWLSKWNHGDAVALQEVANRLENAGEDLWVAINGIPEGNALAQTATLHTLRILYALSALFGGKDEVIDALAQRHAKLAEEFHQLVPAELRRAKREDADG